jgi:hypothetical protein
MQQHHGPLSCTPPRLGRSTLGFDPARFQTKPPACYRASWLLPGPDFHRQATTSLRNGRSTTYMINHPFPLDAPVTDDLPREAEPLVRRAHRRPRTQPLPTQTNPAVLPATRLPHQVDGALGYPSGPGTGQLPRFVRFIQLSGVVFRRCCTDASSAKKAGAAEEILLLLAARGCIDVAKRRWRGQAVGTRPTWPPYYR